MRFYTNVQMGGDQILIRGYEDGKRFSNRDVYKPTNTVIEQELLNEEHTDTDTKE